jgi:Domain of unknown function (DUF4760)
LQIALQTDHLQLYGLWVQTGAIVVSVVGAWITLANNARIGKRRATLDLILIEQTSPQMLDGRQKFNRLRNQRMLVKWADPEQSASDEAIAINAMLNRYEIVAIGIAESTLNERIYKKWIRSSFVYDWIESKPYVMQLRHTRSHPTLFCEFEALAKKWAIKDECDKV